MLKPKINNKNDEIFINNNYNFSEIKNDVVLEIQNENDITEALNLNSIHSNIKLREMLIDSPELFRVNIIGLDISVAFLENLSDLDIVNPAWEVLFKINDIHSPNLNHLDIIYNTKKDGKEIFSYDLLLDRLSKEIKSIIKY